MMETQKSNERLQAEVREELAREHSIDSDAVGITADHGLIFLSGHALGVTRRRTAAEAALRVDGVRAVIDELKIRTGPSGVHDVDLACLAMDSLNQLIGLPDGRVKVIVRDGKVSLKGVVSSPDEKTLIASTVKRAIGCNETLDNAIEVKPGAFPSLGPDFVLTRSPAVRGDQQFEDATPEATAMIVVGETFTDEGIRVCQIRHREFPEIRGEDETLEQAIHRLVHHLDLALEHVRSPWQRDSIEHAIHDVRGFHSSLATGHGHGRSEQHMAEPVDSA